MILVCGLFLIGLFMSAFFSGSETGFYRASRVRLVLDAREGDLISKNLLRLTNNPALFVATTLIGNNIANYLVSLAIVLGVKQIYGNDSQVAEMVAPILLAPVLFVYGESMPKNMFYLAPNRMLRIGAPLFFLSLVVFSPIAAVLWGLSRGLEKIVGESPEKTQATLARKELQGVLKEGQDAGVLLRTQRKLSQNFFMVASKPVANVRKQIPRYQSVAHGTKIRSVLRTAKRFRMANVLVYDGNKNNLIGYVRTIDLLLSRDIEAPIGSVFPLIKVVGTLTYAEVVMTMQSQRCSLALVVDDKDKTIGMVSIEDLTEPLVTGTDIVQQI